MRFDIERREPRCRICRDETVRILVNELLDWRGVPVILVGGNKRRRITYADILGMLEPLNEGRDERDRITYDSLWIHAKRHYDLEGKAAYWSARVYKELRKALAGKRSVGPIEWPQRTDIKYEGNRSPGHDPLQATAEEPGDHGLKVTARQSVSLEQCLKSVDRLGMGRTFPGDR